MKLNFSLSGCKKRSVEDLLNENPGQINFPSALSDLASTMENMSYIFQNIESIEEDRIKFELPKEIPIGEILGRRNLKEQIPRLRACFLEQKNNQARLTAFETSLYGLIVYTYYYQQDISLQEVIPIIYKNNINGLENFKKALSILNKKMRNNFGFKMFFRVKKGFLLIDTKKLPKGN